METITLQSDRASIPELISFGAGQFATNIFRAFITYYLMGFYIDVALIHPAATAVLLFFLNIGSALTDAIAGLFINRMGFKDGKYRPYYKWCAIPFAISLASLCLMPDVGDAGKIIYTFVTIIICVLFYTTLNIAALSMITYSSFDDVSRARMVSFSNAGSILSYIVIGAFLMPIVGFFGGENKQTGFALTLAMFSIITATIHANAYFRVKERHYHSQAFKPAIKDVYFVILRDKRILLFFAGYGIFWLADSFKSQMSYFYVTYNMKRADLLPVVILAGLLMSLIVQPFIPRLLAYAKKETLIVFGLFAASAMGFLLLALGNSIFMLIVYVMLYGAFTAVTANLIYTAMAAFSDEISKIHKINMSDVLLSMMSVSSKFGVAIAGAISPTVLAMSGYSAQAAVQTAGSLFGIKLLYNLCAALGLALSGFILLLSLRSSLNQRLSE